MPAVPPTQTGAFEDEGEVSFELFDGLVNQSLPTAFVENNEKQYYKELDEEKLTLNTQFKYAASLIRSWVSADMHKGILLMEDLSLGNPSGNRDYYFLLSLGYARLKHYAVALKFVNVFLEAEPGNPQITMWQDYLTQRKKREERNEMVMLCGSAVGLGAFVGVAIAIIKAVLRT